MPFSSAEVAAALAHLVNSAFESLQVIDGDALAAQRYPHLDPNAPALVLGLAQANRVQVTAALAQIYGAGHPVQLLSEPTVSLPLGQVDDRATGAALFLPPLARPASYAALQDVVARLRAPDGCPWDRALTWEKLRPSLLEETYELLVALDAADFDKVREEQGDLLLQVAMQAQIAAEEGRFRFADVIAHIVEKLVRRHPHVFGDVEVSGAGEVLANWEAIKAAERAKSGATRSPLAGIPPGLPALAQAEAYLDRMSRLRANTPPAEPWATLSSLGPEEPVSEELVGQAFFELVAWARARGVEAESALRTANARFAEGIAQEEWG